jgi:hypothetical protein
MGIAADLNVPISGLYLLAAPSTPAEVIDAVVERSEQGETRRTVCIEIGDLYHRPTPLAMRPRQSGMMLKAAATASTSKKIG